MRKNRVKDYFFQILFLIILFSLLLIGEGKSQQLPFNNTLTSSSMDTSAILKASWKQINQHYQNGDSSLANKILIDYQKLSCEYGFRFEKEFKKQRLNFSYHQLFDELSILEDKMGILNVEDISLPQYQNKFVSNYSDKNIDRDLISPFPIPKDYNPQSIYWVKLNAINLNEVQEEAWFMVGWNERSWERIEVFKDDGTTIQKVGDSGLRLPLDQKMIKNWRNLIQIKVPPQSRITYYLKLKGVFFPKYPERIALYHYDEKDYWVERGFQLFENGIFSGMTFLLLLVVVMLFYYGRERDTLFFAILLMGIWLNDFADTENQGASNFYFELFPGTLENGQIVAIVGFIMMIFGSVFFPIAFLKAEEFAPKIKKVLILMFCLAIGGYVILAIFNLFLYPYFEYPSEFEWIDSLMVLMLIVYALLPIFILVIAIIAWRKKYLLAKVFIIGYLPLTLSIFSGFIGEALFGMSLSSEEFYLSLKIGHLATYFLFTIAIFYKRQLEKGEIIKKRLELSHRLNLEQKEGKRLKELDTFKSKLYTNLTHEFRTPLTVILGMVEQIKTEPKKYLNEGTRLIEANGKNLLRLINQLLDLSKLENRSFQLNLQQGDIIPYLSYITESFHSYANGKNLSLRFFSPLESLQMDYDVEQIKQILTNLISNAIKFTPSGGEIRVRVTTENDELKIEVKDTGIGILEKDLPNIFDRFYQVDDSTTREREGTGIGLAHTQELVHLMSGRILAKSLIDQGTTFEVSLPIRKEAIFVETIIEKNEFLITLPPKDKATTLENNTSINKILPQLLIVEDNHDVVVYLKTCLEKFYQIDVAFNGKIGIEKAVGNIPDLIVSDVMMPEKDGYEVCDFLKNDERTSHIPIILLTAKADVSSKIVGLKRGADAYLSKPFDKEELLVRLENLMERQKRLVSYFAKKHSITKKSEIENEVEEDIQIEDVFIQKVKKIIEENYSDENFALPQLCQKISMSRSQLFRKMKALVNTSPSDFIRSYRLGKAKCLLETTKMNVSEVSWEVGFKDISHFSKSFQNEFGYLPSATNK